MKTQFAIFILGLIVFAFIWGFRSYRIIRPGRFVLLIFVGFFISQEIFEYTSNYLDLERRSSMLHVLRGLIGQNTGNPVILLAGSSYTARGVDGKIIQDVLQESGYNYAVHQLSYPGAYAFEQDYYIEKYLKHAPVPRIVGIDLITPLGSKLDQNNARHGSMF